MMAKDTEPQSNQLNLTVVALVALVAIVGLVALVINVGSGAKVPLAKGIAPVDATSDQNLGGDARRNSARNRCVTNAMNELQAVGVSASDSYFLALSECE
jgi:hypothetical protein